MSNYPKVNYIGNKEKISSWICDYFPSDAKSLFDAFSGGCSLSYEAKRRGLEVYTNDILKINYHIGNGLVANNSFTLSAEDIDLIFEGDPKKGFMYRNYSNVYFYSEECKELDLYRDNIDNIKCNSKKSLAYMLMRRAMIRKMPYSRFTINWDKIVQLRDEEYSYMKYKRRRAYHNKSFKYHFLDNLNEYNNAIFDNGKTNISYNDDIFNLTDKVKADIIYLDPPYAGTMNNYFGFYGLIDNYIMSEKTAPFKNNFMDKKTVLDLFDNLFSKLSNYKYWFLSYNNSSYPSKDDLFELFQGYSSNIEIKEKKHNYQITGKSKKQKNKEILFIVENSHYDKNTSNRERQGFCKTANRSV